MAAISILSHIYPTIKDPSSGIFIQKEVRLLSSKHNIEVLIPTVRALPFQTQYYRTKNLVDEHFSVSNFKYLSIPKRKYPRFTIWNLVNSMLPHLKSSDTDILHIHWLFPSGLSIPKLKKLGKPIVLTIHGGDWYSNQGKGIDKLIEASLSECNKIICVGNQLKNDLLIKYPNLKHKTYHIPHGINTNNFTPVNSIEKSRIRTHLNWNNNQTHILCVSNLYKVKGVDLLISAFAEIYNENIKLHLVAPRKDRVFETEVLNLITSNKLEDRIHWYPSMDEKELLNFFKAADFLVSSSRKEGFGLVIAEAISCGIPVIATKSGGPDEILTPEVGLLAEVENVGSLANNLKKMIKSFQDYSPTALNDYIKRNFSRELKLERLSKIYDDLK